MFWFLRLLKHTQNLSWRFGKLVLWNTIWKTVELYKAKNFDPSPLPRDRRHRQSRILLTDVAVQVDQNGVVYNAFSECKPWQNGGFTTENEPFRPVTTGTILRHHKHAVFSSKTVIIWLYTDSERTVLLRPVLRSVYGPFWCRKGRIRTVSFDLGDSLKSLSQTWLKHCKTRHNQI
jgi:hypothetical protein